MGDKNNDVFLVVQIKDRQEDMPRFYHVKFHFDVDRFSNIEPIHHDTRFSLNPHGSHAHHLIARSLAGVRPFLERLDVAGMEVVIDDVMRRPFVHDFTLVQQNRLLAHSGNGRHVMRNQNHRSPMLPYILHLAHALLLKADVPHCQQSEWGCRLG